VSSPAGTTSRGGAGRPGAKLSRPAPRPPKETRVASPSGETTGVAILIAARPALYREILARQLSGEPDFRISGLARDEDGILALLNKERPRVLLLDYEGLGPNAEALIPRLRRAAPATRILLLATRSGDETVERVLRAGASGLVAKQLGFDVLVRAIRAVAAGELWANRRVTARTVEHLAETQSRDAFEEQLTSRESEIAEAVGRGLRNKEIARRLQISEKTVKSHLNNIFRKLQVDNRFAVGLYVLSLPNRVGSS
jgi:DNA-binding NarL/FixJ family response regulator